MTNHNRFAYAAESSIRTQYLHIPSQRKHTASGPTIPRMPHGILIQSGTLAVTPVPKNAGVKASARIVEARNKLDAWRVISQSSLNLFHSPEGPMFSRAIGFGGRIRMVSVEVKVNEIKALPAMPNMHHVPILHDVILAF